MRYLGGKARLAKYILPIILKDRKPNQLYIEPFLGGANTFCKVKGSRIGNDIHEELIAMWKALVNGWEPPNQNTTKYKHKFNSKLFFDWATKISKYSKIFISEQQAPKPFKQIFEKSIVNSINNKIQTEKLFTI